MNIATKNELIKILRSLIQAHSEQDSKSDFHTKNLEEMVEGLESGDFFNQTKQDQIASLYGFNGKYLGKAEIFRILVPKYLPFEFMSDFRAAFSEAIKEVKSEI